MIWYAIATNQAGERRASRPLTIFVRTFNDNFADALAIEDLQSGDFVYFSGATLEPGEPDYGGAAGTGSRWWRWTAPATGDAELTLRNHDGVAIFTGATLNSLAPIPVERVESGGHISWRFATQRGVTYQMALFGTPLWPAIFDRFSWSPVRFPGLAREQVLFTDERVEVVVDLPASDVQHVELYADSDRIGEAYEPPFVVRIAALWFLWTAPRSGSVQVTTRAATTPFVFVGSTLDSVRPVGSSQFGSAMFDAEAGLTYRIAAAGLIPIPPPPPFPPFLPPPFDFQSLQYSRTPSRPANDDFADAELLTDAAVTLTGDTRFATREFREPLHAGFYGGRSVWWQWTAPRSSRVQLITAPRTDRGYEIAVYRGDSLAALTPVAARAFSGYGGNLGFNAVSGAVYRIALDGTYGTEVQVDFELRQGGPVEAPQIIRVRRDADAAIRLHLRGTAGAAFTLEGSIDLQNWSDEQRGTVDFRGEQLVQIPAPTADRKFFRIRTE